MILPPLAPIVAGFLLRHVASIEELEILMLLVMSGGRWWDATSASREAGIPVGSARAALDALASQNLLDIRITEDVRYQFRPGNVALEEAALATAAVYQRSPEPLIQAVKGGRSTDRA